MARSFLSYRPFIARPCRVAVVAGIMSFAGHAGADLASEITVRARITEVTPKEPVRIYFRTGGEGFGGAVIRGELTTMPSDPNVLAQFGKRGTDYFPASDKPGSPMWILPGRWSPEVPLSAMDPHGRPPFVTFTIDGQKSGAKSATVLKGVTTEIQFLHKGKVLKSVVEKGPDGPTATLQIGFDKLTSARAFVDGTMGISTVAKRRLEFLQSLPWAKRPVPRKFGIVTDCYGYGAQSGFAIRTSDRDVILTELRSVRELGVNGLRQVPDFVLGMLRSKQGIGAEFSRIRVAKGLGYPVPIWNSKGNLASGCPYHPSMAGFRDRMKAETATAFADPWRRLSAEEVWLMEIDEVGSVFDFAPESKAHMGACPYCQKAFRDYLRNQGLGPADFDAKSWDDLRSTYGYWQKTFAERHAADSKTPPPTQQKIDGYALEWGARDQLYVPKVPDPAGPGWPVGPPSIVQEGKRAPLSEKGWAKLYYYSRKFNSDSSAMLLGPERDFLAEQNEAKRRAITQGRLEVPEAQQPWVEGFTLRGVNFLIGGHSLEYFEFYRLADNAFVYETSNRDPRAWQWDSYMCDVGRVLVDKMGRRFGAYVKPHRGAVIQRALAAGSREATMLFWYTYGPDWEKGDSFSVSQSFLSATSRAARLLAAAEDVIYEAKWAVPPEIAVIRPRTSEFFESDASWENGKWIYTALQHQHLPVDPIDEVMVEKDDLSRYKVIYVSGSHFLRSAAKKLAQWVQNGGTLYTSGGGLVRDEANQPLTVLDPVFGLRNRANLEFWHDVPRYGATALKPFWKVTKDVPAYATITGTGPFTGSFPLVIAREVLEPAPGTEILATFGDGKPAVTRHAYGKGFAYVAEYFAGVEYSSDVVKDDYDMSKDFNPVKASFVAVPARAAGVRPVVDASVPLVEGILLKNTKTGKAAVSLINWAYKTHPLDPLENPPMNWDPIPFESVGVDIRYAGPVARVVSAWTGRPLSFTRNGDVLHVIVPKLEEADVLLFD